MAYLLHEQERKSLEVLSSVYLGLPPYKGVDYKNIMDEPLEKIALMNGRDAMRTFNLYRPLADELNQNTKLSRLYQWLLMPAINALIEITENGVPVDLARITALSQAVQAKLKVMATGLVMRAPKPVNPNSSQQVADLLFNHWELPILKTTEKGNPSVDADTRRQLIPKAPPEAAEFLEYLDEYKHLTTRSKHISNWLGLLDDNNHLHPRYKPLHVVTGRLSSESPNIQNVPRDPAYRGVFGGVPGHSWLKADLSQIELRLAAWIAKEPTMLRAYREGEDLHALTAEAVLGESEGPARQTGKTLNFGLLYGAGANTLERIARTEYGLILEPGQAAEYRDRFFKLYPRLGLWHRTMYKEVERDGISVSPMGRIRHLPDATYTGDDDDLRGKKYKAIREGINHPVQSFASDILLMSVVRLRERGLGPYMVAEVHDEIDFVVPDEMVEETKAEIENTMNDMEWLKRFGIELTVPVLTEVTIGTHWSEG
jgi:DNA polymerase-1